MPKPKPRPIPSHPRKDLRQAWAFLGMILASVLLLCFPLGWLPLYESRMGVLGQHVAQPPLPYDWGVPLAIGAGFGLALPFAAMLVNRRHIGAILRPTAGRVLSAALIVMALPGAILADGTPLNPAPLWLMAALRGAEVRAEMTALLLGALLLLYPLTSALIYGTPRLWRIPALLMLPVGLYLFVILAGGRI